MTGATTIRQLADVLRTVRDRDERLSGVPTAEQPNGHQTAVAACFVQSHALTSAILREPPQGTSDLRLLLMAAADGVEDAADRDDLPDDMEGLLRGVLIALEHVIVHPALGPVSPQDEAWNVPLYRKRAEARLIDPSQVQQPEQAA